MIQATGKTIISDNSTRWKSSFFMSKRLGELRPALPDILAKHLQVDNLLVSEWEKLDELVSLLEPLAGITISLQSDAKTLSKIYPSLLELECHLSTFQTTTAVAKKAVEDVLKDFRSYFATILQ